MSDQPVREVPIVFVGAENAPVFFVHGGYGGPGPRGDVIVNLYVDSWKLPDEARLVATEGGVEEQAEPLHVLVRKVVAQLVLPPVVARSLGEWLVRRAEDAERLAEEATKVQR